MQQPQLSENPGYNLTLQVCVRQGHGGFSGGALGVLGCLDGSVLPWSVGRKGPDWVHLRSKDDGCRMVNRTGVGKPKQGLLWWMSPVDGVLHVGLPLTIEGPNTHSVASPPGATVLLTSAQTLSKETTSRRFLWLLQSL